MNDIIKQLDQLPIAERIRILEKRVDIISDNLKDCCDAINTNALCIRELRERGSKMHEVYFKRFEIGERSIKDAAEMINGLQGRMMQMQEAYYHVFPERLAQDARLTEQLKTLKTKASRDADPDEA